MNLTSPVSPPNALWSELIPYGAAHWTAAQHAALLATSDHRGGSTPCVRVSKGTLRLYDLQAYFSSVAGQHDSEQGIGFVHRALCALCAPWDPLMRGFVTAYLHAMEQRLAQAEPEFRAYVQQFEGLFQLEDWFYSAPAPLPQAHLYAPLAHEGPRGDEQDFVAVSFAFSIGGVRLAVLGARDALTPLQQRKTVQRLQQAGIKVLTGYDPSILTQQISAILGETESRFWRQDPLPKGPFLPKGLAPLSALFTGQ